MRFFTWMCAVLAALSIQVAAKPLTVVENGKSTYSIYHDAQGPKTVKRAAFELQAVIEKATGVKLPVKTAPGSPMICVGVNETSRAAGADKDLPDIGFRLVTKGDDIFILGNDSADSQEPWLGMARRGTLLGAFDFCEKALNVRWLMPDDIGEDIPKTDKFVVKDLNVTETPTIAWRWLDFVGDRSQVVAWKDHNKADIRPRGGGVNWGHSFNSYPTEAMRAAHPEILSVNKEGSPVKMDKGHVMYCLSKPILYDLFAECITNAFANNPKLYSMSMSPDEGADFCSCPDCTKIAMPIPDMWKNLGANAPQRTPAVLHFYNEVARRVRKDYPDRVIGAFLYQAYMVPLPEPIKMEPNIVFGIAINSAYGFKFYHPQRREMFQKFFDEWGKYGATMGYYSYDTWLRNWFGFPIPPGRGLMKWNFPMYKRNRVQYLSYVGQEAWGYSAIHNWMAAKLMWNADADVDALFNEFLTRAYGAEAGPLIGKIYDLTEEKLQAYIQSFDATKGRPDHEVDYAMAKAVYAPIWTEVERLYLEAVSKTKTDLQRQRLEMLGDNLILGHHNMWKAKLMPDADAKSSPLHKSTDDLDDWIQEKEKGFSISPFSSWVKTYGYTERPILRPNWRPK